MKSECQEAVCEDYIQIFGDVGKNFKKRFDRFIKKAKGFVKGFWCLIENVEPLYTWIFLISKLHKWYTRAVDGAWERARSGLSGQVKDDCDTNLPGNSNTQPYAINRILSSVYIKSALPVVLPIPNCRGGL